LLVFLAAFFKTLKTLILGSMLKDFKDLTMLKDFGNPDAWLSLLLIDLQKAFDLIDHNILVNKLLTEFQVSTILVKIVASF